MVIIERCPVCGHELISGVIESYPMAYFKYCRNCDWLEEQEPEYKDDEDKQGGFRYYCGERSEPTRK